MAFIKTKGGSKWATTAKPKDPADLDDLTGIVYRHPAQRRLLIQWLYDGFKPYTEPAYFYPTDLPAVRRDLARGFKIIVRGPRGAEADVTRHTTYADLQAFAFGPEHD